MLQSTPAREYAPGMGQAVADRTINRRKSDGTTEIWADVARRVAIGNSLLHPPRGDSVDDRVSEIDFEFTKLHHHLRQASILMSGRHLQHGDETQPTRPMEVFTNCSTSAASFLTFYLLLNGSGVGRAYDDNMIVANLNLLPTVLCVVDQSHKDVLSGEISAMDLKTAKRLYKHKKVTVFEVPDSREGWAKAIEVMEVMAYQGKRTEVLILDFSKVRPKGSPIAGMQNRPASGPAPLMSAIANVARLRDAGMEPWRAALFADHYLSECVLVAGARRAARMSTKWYLDPGIFDFIAVKRGGFLWSSNNSVTVDSEFWRHVKNAAAGLHSHDPYEDERQAHAYKVYEAICDAAYHDQTGEPGIITVDKLTHSDEGIEVFFDGNFAESARYKLSLDAKDLMADLARAWQKCEFKVITNPCGEIVLIMLGGYCVIADVVPFHAGYAFKPERATNEGWAEYFRKKLDDAEDAYRVATRALIRTNTMDSLYSKEVRRTNRIGVGITGLHEFAFETFGFGWKDLVNEQKSLSFWLTMSRFKRAVKDEARKYATELGVAVPMTDTTIKPAGTTSKLFGLTEGAHLPTMREFMRWVQFRNDDPLVEKYRAMGYPIRKLQVYAGTTIVGFPTAPTICTLGMGDKLVTAAEATPEEQYEYLRLLEKYWITGVEEDGVTPLSESGNQVSYTLKYNPKTVSYEQFKKTLLEGQSTIRCCSVMPQSDTSAYEYLPEQPVTKHEFEQVVATILAAAAGAEAVKEDVGMEHVACEGGACPIDFGTNSASA